MSLTRAEASARGRIGAHVRWSREGDRVGATAAARRTFLESFERQVDPNGELDPSERSIRAEHAHKAHMQRMALASVKARAARRNTG